MSDIPRFCLHVTWTVSIPAATNRENRNIREPLTAPLPLISSHKGLEQCALSAADAHSFQETGSRACPARSRGPFVSLGPSPSACLHGRPVHPAFHSRAPSSGTPDPMRSPSLDGDKASSSSPKRQHPPPRGSPTGPGSGLPGGVPVSTQPVTLALQPPV